jgi:AAHS family 4-hydroxybenzoate transporter-like MFS transporter
MIPLRTPPSTGAAIGTQAVDIGQIVDRSPISALQVRILVVCILVAMVDGFDTQAVAFVGPSLGKAWGLSKATLGTLFSATLLGSALGAVLFGRLSDQFGRRALMALGLAVFGSMTLGSAMSRGPADLLVFRVLAGVGLGGALPSLLAFVSEYAPARSRATLVVICMWGYPAGGALGGLLSIRLIEAYDWKAVFWVGGAMPLVLVPLTLLFLPESISYLVSRNRVEQVRRLIAQIDPTHVHAENVTYSMSTVHELRAPLRSVLFGTFASSTYLLGGSLFLSLLLAYFLVNWVPTLLHDIGLPLNDSILAVVALNVTGIFGSFVLCRLVDRYRSDVRIVAGGFLAAAIAVASTGLLGNLPHAMLLGLAMVGFFLIGSQMALTAYTSTYYPSALRATGLGVTQAMGRIGSVMGPLIAGLLLSTHLSPQQLLRLGAFPALLSAFLLLVLRHTSGLARIAWVGRSQ